MATFLFDKIVFGPVNSRRLGVSLGINLLPVNRKICNFDCIYCECGLNLPEKLSDKLPSRNEVFKSLNEKLSEMSKNNITPNVITFAGNGEPTLHPQFLEIIDDVIELRDSYFPETKISVLSNATMLHRTEIVEALKKIDQNILKLDAGTENTAQLLNQPLKQIPREKLIDQLCQFEGKLIIQSMFTRGQVNGSFIDNTPEQELEPWLSDIVKIKPQMVMIYTVDRDTPYEGLKKIPVSELEQIASKIKALGLNVQVSG